MIFKIKKKYSPRWYTLKTATAKQAINIIYDVEAQYISTEDDILIYRADTTEFFVKKIKE